VEKKRIAVGVYGCRFGFKCTAFIEKTAHFLKQIGVPLPALQFLGLITKKSLRDCYEKGYCPGATFIKKGGTDGAASRILY
jgi:hypothetical protein